MLISNANFIQKTLKPSVSHTGGRKSVFKSSSIEATSGPRTGIDRRLNNDLFYGTIRHFTVRFSYAQKCPHWHHLQISTVPFWDLDFRLFCLIQTVQSEPIVFRAKMTRLEPIAETVTTTPPSEIAGTSPERSNLLFFPCATSCLSVSRHPGGKIPPPYGTAQNRPVHAEKQAYFSLDLYSKYQRRIACKG